MENMFRLSFLIVSLFARCYVLEAVPNSLKSPQRLPASQLQFVPAKKFPYPLKEPISKPNTRVKTVAVYCHEDYIEILVKADLFGLGIPIDVTDLRLGADSQPGAACWGRVVSPEEYIIAVALTDCGMRHWITDDSLIYTNLLVYSPTPTPDGLIRMEEVVIPVECHYGRRFELSSNSVQPTWIAFTSTQSAVDTLDFSLTLMTSDWLSERVSKVYFLGDFINIQASYQMGYHTELRVFVEECVATISPDLNSVPRYVFIQNHGCLTDSLLTASRSRYLPRVQSEKLRIQLDAFRFHEEESSEIYITCHLRAYPVTDNTEPESRACSYSDGRWTSADGEDWRCDSCQPQDQTLQYSGTHPYSGTHQYSGMPLRPRMQSPAQFERIRPSATSRNVFGQDAAVGPLSVFSKKHKLGSLAPPAGQEAIPALSPSKGDRRPIPHSSLWKNGKNAKMDKQPFAPHGRAMSSANKLDGVSVPSWLMALEHLIDSPTIDPITTAASAEREDPPGSEHAGKDSSVPIPRTLDPGAKDEQEESKASPPPSPTTTFSTKDTSPEK
ncbi:zona pellucida sperm-binding protein 3-like [Chanos chanos]|uniref:Zona pellucida sperm-binding protein 3 n=1 Tax=Chanos chanos TaxID=29144 RepID=A0A6J2WWT0_CHACN|nr:zona pellucida sperm-binding protein 3-like [Chanos chanos]